MVFIFAKMNILQLKDICKSFDKQIANDHISLEVPRGSIFGLLGPNGAGKTTLIRIITYIIGADSGEILFEGQPLQPHHQEKIGYMPEERGLYRKMQVGEHLLYLARLKNLSKAEARRKIDYWAKKMEITGWLGKKVEELSKGMQQKVQFVATVLHDPTLLILDEPFSGLDPINAQMIQNEIFDLHQKGVTVLFSTHRMEQVEQICKEIALINKGKIILRGRVHEIKQQFKEHIFRIDYDPLTDDSVLADINIIEKEHSHVVFRLGPEESANEVLRKLIDRQVTIRAFHEILPTLNQIFIQQVTQTNTKNPLA